MKSRKSNLSRRDFLKATGIMAGSVLLSACSEYIQEVSTPTPTLTVSPTSTKTLTPTPTQTPEPTATHTPTATLRPRIEMNVVQTEDGRVEFAFPETYHDLPQVIDLAKQLGEEPLSKSFFRKLLNFIQNTSVGSQPLYKPFSDNVVQVPWVNTKYETLFRSDTVLDVNNCSNGKLIPIHHLFAFQDSRHIYKVGDYFYDIFYVLQQIYNPLTESETVTPVAFIGQLGEKNNVFKYVNSPRDYFAYAHHFIPQSDGQPYSYMETAKMAMEKVLMQDGGKLYNESNVDDVIDRSGIFDPFFQTQPITGSIVNFSRCTSS